MPLDKWGDSTEVILENRSAEQQSVTVTTLFVRTVFINLTNPKAIFFLIALFSMFFNLNPLIIYQVLVLGVTSIVVDSLVMIDYAHLSSLLRPLLKKKIIMPPQNRIFGSLFVETRPLLTSFKF
jgi:homoserine/homoserine lactone efflux protein